MSLLDFLVLVLCRKDCGASHKDQAARCPQSSVFTGEMSMTRIKFTVQNQTAYGPESFELLTGGHLSQHHIISNLTTELSDKMPYD